MDRNKKKCANVKCKRKVTVEGNQYCYGCIWYAIRFKDKKFNLKTKE